MAKTHIRVSFSGKQRPDLSSAHSKVTYINLYVLPLFTKKNFKRLRYLFMKNWETNQLTARVKLYLFIYYSSKATVNDIVYSIACLAALERHGECLALVNRRLEEEKSNTDLYVMRSRLHLMFKNVCIRGYCSPQISDGNLSACFHYPVLNRFLCVLWTKE